MKRAFVLIMLLSPFLLAVSCDDEADSERIAQCRNACATDYESKIGYCYDTYADTSDAQEGCLNDASKEQSECMEKCE